MKLLNEFEKVQKLNMTTPPKNDHPLENDHPLYERTVDDVPTTRREKPKRAPEDRPYVTYILIAINLLIFLAGFASEAVDRTLFIQGALFPPYVVELGQVYRLFTAMFLHGSVGHIFFNMYALYIVGVTLEPIFGRVRFMIIYFLGGLLGSALSLALGNYEVPSVGASGAVFAIFAAQAVHFYLHRNLYQNVTAQLRQMIFLIGMNLFIGFVPGSRIDNWGHIGGLIGGALLAWRISPRLQRPTFVPKSMHDLAKTDTNPLVRHLPEVVLYCFALIGIVVVAINMLAP